MSEVHFICAQQVTIQPRALLRCPDHKHTCHGEDHWNLVAALFVAMYLKVARTTNLIANIFIGRIAPVIMLNSYLMFPILHCCHFPAPLCLVVTPCCACVK